MKAEYIAPTPAEVKEIKHGNRETINRLYTANYAYITMLAKRYCARVCVFHDWQDLTQEVYLHFDKIDFDSPAYFGHCVYKIFSNYRYGGQRKRQQLKGSKCGEEYYVLDKPIDGEEKEFTTIGESLASDFDVIAEIEPRPDVSESLFNYLCGYLAREQKRVFTPFYWTGKTYNEIARELGKNPRTVKRTREEIFKKLRNNADSLKSWLYEVGYYESA